MIHVFTPSFNKKSLVKDCIDSVMNQRYKNFTYWIIENSTDIETKEWVHKVVEQYHDPRIILVDEYVDRSIPHDVSGTLFNKYLEYMNGIILWRSDDDLLDPSALEIINEELKDDKKDIVYWSMATQAWNNNGFVHRDTRYARNIIDIGTNVDCMIDNGQMAFRSDCLKELTKPYWRTQLDNDTAHADGIFMNRLVERNRFYPIYATLSIKRTGPLSEYTKI